MLKYVFILIYLKVCCIFTSTNKNKYIMSVYTHENITLSNLDETGRFKVPKNYYKENLKNFKI